MAIMEGPLSKWTNVMKGWQYRWFVLDENSGLLSYYTSKEKMMRGARRGCVRLKGAVIGIDDEDDSTFTLTVDQKTFHFQARDADEKERWIDALENTILRHSQPIARWERQPVPSMNEFDRKLAETDAYLQILIEQVKDLDDRISRCDDDESRSKLNLIKEAAENMIESIKQSIVLLQITKQNVSTRTVISPANNTDEGIQNDFVILDVPRQIDDAGSTENSHQGKLNGAAISKRGLGAQCAVSEVTSSNHLAAVAAAASGAVPDSSYSSSEDEDFVDAEEYTSDHVNGVEEEPPLPPKIIASQDDYFDELYDNIEEEDLGTLEGHGSMITHLLSQVRIGMDLTKVVLPTFILEKRSLLEMFADFFAHPDIFVGIVDQPTPRDRMVQAVRWYLSAFHAGRRTHVAKKPYNPIIGETFRCYYDVPNVPPEQEKYNDGPIPWSTKSNVSFLAEQVSHHPPISAFYAECAKKRISMDGYIWTKSKFLGLSIGVHMIGQGHIAVPDHDEDYIITFPNAYGRSILTIPWMELGGKVGVNCPKTGYYANIEFLTKPFYGGKKDQVTAEIFAPNEKKPFCTIKGEWNGVMWAKYDTGMNEIFVDTKNMPVIKKRVLPIEQQEEFESRRLWRDVTYNLKVKNIEAATNFKHKLEQRQREEARIRKEQGAKWETKQFHEVGEHWVYDRTLVKRLNKAAAMTKEELLIDYENPEQPQ